MQIYPIQIVVDHSQCAINHTKPHTSIIQPFFSLSANDLMYIVFASMSLFNLQTQT